MKIKVLKTNIFDIATFEAGMKLLSGYLSSVIDNDISYQETGFLFTSEAFTNMDMKGYQVRPEEILAQSDGTEDISFLIFDNTKVTPSPLNPTCAYYKKGNATPCQMCQQWYYTFPETFAQYFLHEICHAMYFLLGITSQDMTHLMTNRTMNPALYDQWVRHSLTDYYLFIIKSLLPAWNTYKAGQKIIMDSLKLGTKSTIVGIFQHNLNRIGNYNLVADGDFGKKTQDATKDFQKTHGLKPDGVAGPVTQDAIKCVLAIMDVSSSQSVDLSLMLAVASCEGGFSSKITNTNKNGSIDRGIYQWNNKEHPEITDYLAFDPTEAAMQFAKALKANPANLHAWWSASQKCWAKKVSKEVLAKYGIV